MFIPFRVKVTKEDNEKLKLEDLGIEVEFDEEETEEIIIEVNAMHIVTIEPCKEGYVSFLSDGRELLTSQHPFSMMTQGNYN